MAKFSIAKWRKKAISMYGKARGLSKGQRDKVTKAVHGKTYKPQPTQKKVDKRKSRRVPRKMNKRRSGFGIRSLFKWLRVGAFIAPGVYQVSRGGDAKTRVSRVMSVYTGYHPADGSFNLSRLAQGWGPYLATVLITVGIGKLSGILRRL